MVTCPLKHSTGEQCLYHDDSISIRCSVSKQVQSRIPQRSQGLLQRMPRSEAWASAFFSRYNVENCALKTTISVHCRNYPFRGVVQGFFIGFLQLLRVGAAVGFEVRGLKLGFEPSKLPLASQLDAKWC